MPFLELSQMLTGVTPLPVDLAVEYESRIRAIGGGVTLDRLLSIHLNGPKGLADILLNDDELRQITVQIVILWYCGALVCDANDARPALNFEKPDHHFRALLWNVIGAHPPALSGGYFGHWHYPPEN
jgi:hypothetical protein